MKVILREDVERVGKIGDLVEVADGYARNFLIPKKLAAEATVKNVRALEHERRLIADKAKKDKKEALEQAKKIGEAAVTIPVKVGEEDKLFGSVTAKDIAEALLQKGIQIDKKKIQLESPLKELGQFDIPVKLHHDTVASLKVSIVKEV